jgi:hypothetical protein
MRVVVRIPPRYLPIYLEAKETARLQRLNNPDPRIAVLQNLQDGRAQRDRQAKILRTMEIARLRTAERKLNPSGSSRCQPDEYSASQAVSTRRRERRGNVIVIDFGGGRG